MLTDNDYRYFCQCANDWRYLMVKQSIGMTREQLMTHRKHTTKADLDAWLMVKFNLDCVTAREISNGSETLEARPFVVGNGYAYWNLSRKEPTFTDYPELE